MCKSCLSGIIFTIWINTQRFTSSKTKVYMLWKPFEMLSLRSWKQNAANSRWGAVVLTVSFSKGGKRRNKERRLKSKLKRQNPKWVTKGQKNKSCSEAPTSCIKHIRKTKGQETWKDSKLRRGLTSNNNVLQNGNNLSSLQNYSHPLPKESTQNIQRRATCALS